MNPSTNPRVSPRAFGRVCLTRTLPVRLKAKQLSRDNGWVIRVCVWVCECSHPFTTITQTSQASGSVPKPIHPNDKYCLHSDGYLKTDKLAVRFDLCFILSSSKSCDPQWAGDPLLIYCGVLLFSSLLLQEEKTSAGGMRKCITETVSRVNKIVVLK